MKRLIVLAVLAASMAGAATRLNSSWGKAGVALDAYRADALACGQQAYYLDVSNTKAAKVLVDASARIEDLMQGADRGTDPANTYSEVARQVDAANPAQRMREVAAVQQDALAQCLTARGYRRFRLTAAQQHRLNKLRKGSPERREYLHGLASDPAVLAAQAE